MDNPQGGRKQFMKRLSECADDPAALLKLGKSCFLAEAYQDAIDVYKKCIGLQRKNDAAHFNMGVAYQALGRNRDAKKAFLKALELNPNQRAAQDALNGLAAY